MAVRPPGTEHLHGHLHPPPLGMESSGSGGAAAMMWNLVMKSRNSLWMPRGGGARATSGRLWTCITMRLDGWYVSELPLCLCGCFYIKECKVGGKKKDQAAMRLEKQTYLLDCTKNLQFCAFLSKTQAVNVFRVLWNVPSFHQHAKGKDIASSHICVAV